MSTPRKLEERDVVSFFEAASQRQTAPKNIEELRAIIRRENPARWWRLRGDMRWIRKTLKKRGYNPDDAPWLLP